MENKYYTPSIEEFHIGFQYEEVTPCGYGDVLMWREQKYSIFHCKRLYKVQSQIKRGNIRVKHLDKEDIESLGFTFYTSRHSIITVFRKGEDMELEYTPDYNTVKVISRGYFREDDRVLFNGKIKNKSELQKILSMIGVI